ncbi:MAG: hypothetical protein ACRCTI_11820, partial [Beijerinckiaceae bacterium]
PAAAHLSAGADPLLVAVWKQHIRSQELIGLFAVTLQRTRGPAGWVRQRRASLWRHPSLPLAPFLLSADRALAAVAVNAFRDWLIDQRAGLAALPAVDVGGAAAAILSEAAAQRGWTMIRKADAPHSRGLDIMLSGGAPVATTVTREPLPLRVMLEQALAMDAAFARGLDDPQAVVFDSSEVAFLRAVVRGFSHLDRIVGARVSDDGMKAVALAVAGRDRAYLWRIFGPSAHDPRAEVALVRGIRNAVGMPVFAAASHPVAGFCTDPLRTESLEIPLP